MRKLLTVPLVPVLLLLGAGGAAAADDPLACGDTITSDTTLTRSLYCEDGPGLRIDTPGVTLDLGGFAVQGNAGIGISVTADDVVVRGGTVTDWPVGVYTGTPANESEYAGGFELPEPDYDAPAPTVLLEGLSIRRSDQLGLEVATATTTLRGSRLVGSDIGARSEYGGDLTLDRTEVSGNSLGLQGLEGGPVHVGKSLLRLNGTAAACSEGLVEISDSVVADNGGGFDSFICGGSSVVRSVFSRNVVHISSEGFPDQLPEVGCTVFLGGGPAPDFPKAPCF